MTGIEARPLLQERREAQQYDASAEQWLILCVQRNISCLNPGLEVHWRSRDRRESWHGEWLLSGQLLLTGPSTANS
jgi:hypothetical protein